MLSERRSRLRDFALFLALALLPTLAVGVLGLRAFAGEESAQRRVLVASLGASAERLREHVEQSLATADAALLTAMFEPGLDKTRGSLTQLAPPYALPFVLDGGRELLEPREERRPSLHDTGDAQACGQKQKAWLEARDAAKKALLRKEALGVCGEERGPEGRFVFPVLALSGLLAEDVPLVLGWLRTHAALLGVGERSATREEIRASVVMDEASRREALSLLDASPDTREQVLAALRTEACAEALRQGPDRAGMMRFRAPSAIGVIRALEPGRDGRLLGFVVTRESLQAGLVRETGLLLPDQRLALAGIVSDAEAGRAMFAGARELGVVVVPADPHALDKRAALSRRILVAIGLGAMLVSFLLLGLLWTRMQRARRTSELRVDFLSALSHELRTPASSMQMFAELLAGGHVEKGEQDEVFAALSRESKRLSATIERMLSLGRMTKGKLVATPTEQLVGPVVEEAIEAFEARFEALGPVERSIDESASAPLDAGLFRLALDNLLDNARKYAPEGTPYRVSVEKASGRVRVRVSDRGPGIAKRDQRRIFAPFERLDDKLSRETEGSGLGLSLVEAVMRAHGGEVRVESELGKGTTFVLILDARSKARLREEA